jgi:hypothetical protein
MFQHSVQQKRIASKWIAAWSYFYSRRFVFIAILVHAVLILLFGDYVLLSSWFKNNEEVPLGAFVAAPKTLPSVTEDSAPKNLDVSVDVQQPQEAASAPRLMDVITTTRSQSFNLPSTDDGLVSKLMDSSNLGAVSGSGSGSGLNAGTGIGKVSAKSLFGTSIDAKNLAVVLDMSGSMDKVLPLVKIEVMQQFPQAVVVFSQSCSFIPLKPGQEKQELSWKKVRQFFPECLNVSQFFRKMTDAVDFATTLKQVDGIWLVADFRDAVDEQLVAGLLAKCRQEKKKLYIHSVELQPAESLMQLSSGTGGKVNVAPIKDRANAANKANSK